MERAASHALRIYTLGPSPSITQRHGEISLEVDSAAGQRTYTETNDCQKKRVRT